MNHRTLISAAPLALLTLLAACGSQPDTADAGNDAAANAAAAPVELPPMMTAQRTYRCKDNSLVHIDFFNNNTALLKTDKDAPTGTTLTRADASSPFTAEGYSLSGDGAEVELTAPGKGATSCKA